MIDYTQYSREALYLLLDDRDSQIDILTARVAEMETKFAIKVDVQIATNMVIDAYQTKLTIATEALEKIVKDGDYTAPEGMQYTARTALERIRK